MDKFSRQEKLWSLPAYQALDGKRRKAANANLVEGKSFYAACKEQKLNPSRERNGLLEVCRRTFLELSGPLDPATDRPLDIYQQAALLERQQEAESERAARGSTSSTSEGLGTAEIASNAKIVENSPNSGLETKDFVAPEKRACFGCGLLTDKPNGFCPECDPPDPEPDPEPAWTTMAPVQPQCAVCHGTLTTSLRGSGVCLNCVEVLEW